jgi:hypothetical protein
MSPHQEQHTGQLVQDEQGKWRLTLTPGIALTAGAAGSCVFEFHPEGKDDTHSGWVKVSGPASCPTPGVPPPGKGPVTVTVACPPNPAG